MLFLLFFHGLAQRLIKAGRGLHVIARRDGQGHLDGRQIPVNDGGKGVRGRTPWSPVRPGLPDRG